MMTPDIFPRGGALELKSESLRCLSGRRQTMESQWDVLEGKMTEDKTERARPIA